MEWVEPVTTMINTIVVVFGGWIAWRGVDSWRSEMSGRRRAELAEEVLTMAYEAKDNLAWARNAMTFVGEGETRPAEDGLPEDERVRSQRNMYYVPAERLLKSAEFWARWGATEYRVRALFDVQAADAFRMLHAIRTRVALSSKALARHVGEHPEDRPPSESFRKWEADIGYGLSDTDEVQSKIDNVVRSLETVCRPAIEGGYDGQHRAWWKWPTKARSTR